MPGTSRSRRMLGLSVLSLLGCTRAPEPGPLPLPPAAYTLGELLGGGELRGATIRADGSEAIAVVRSNDGWSLSAIPFEGGAPRRLATDPPLAGERLRAGSPRGDVWLLERGRDGGRGQGELLVRVPSGRLVPISSPNANRSDFLGWTGGGNGVLLATDENVADRIDVVEVRLDDFSRTTRFVNELRLRLGPLSPDGRVLAVATADSGLGPGLGALDLPSGTLREVGVSDELRGWIAPQAFTADGRAVVVLDIRSQPARCLRIRMSDGHRLPVALPCPDPLRVRLSATDRYLLVECREDSGSPHLVLSDARTATRLDLPLPRGVAPLAVGFDSQDRRLIVEAGGATRGSDLFAWSPNADFDRQLTYLLDPRVDARDLVEPRSVPTVASGDPPLQAESYLPVRHESEWSSGAVVLLEDSSNDEPLGAPPYAPLAQYLANHGQPVLRVVWSADDLIAPRGPNEVDPQEAALARLSRVVAPFVREHPQRLLIGDGPHSARVALELAARSDLRWEGVAGIRPEPVFARPAEPIAPRPSPPSSRTPPLDWIDRLPLPASGPNLMLLTCEGSRGLPPADRDRLIRRLASAGRGLTLEVLPGDAACLEHPGTRDRGWATVARFARSLGRATDAQPNKP